MKGYLEKKNLHEAGRNEIGQNKPKQNGMWRNQASPAENLVVIYSFVMQILIFPFRSVRN